MTDLTEKWKAGELESGYYYIVVKRVEFPNRIDFYNSSITAWSYHSNDCVEQVLAPVPSYEEHLESEAHCAVYSEENKSLNLKISGLQAQNAELIETNDILSCQNQQLKALLKDYKEQLSEIKDAYIDLTTQDEYGSYYIDEAKLFVETVGKTIKDYDELELKQDEVLK